MLQALATAAHLPLPLRVLMTAAEVAVLGMQLLQPQLDARSLLR